MTWAKLVELTGTEKLADMTIVEDLTGLVKTDD